MVRKTFLHGLEKVDTNILSPPRIHSLRAQDQSVKLTHRRFRTKLKKVIHELMAIAASLDRFKRGEEPYPWRRTCLLLAISPDGEVEPHVLGGKEDNTHDDWRAPMALW